VLALAADDIAAMAPAVNDAPVRRRASIAGPRMQAPEEPVEPEPAVTIKRRLIERVACPARTAPSWRKRHQRNQDHADAPGEPACRSGLGDLPGRDPSGAALMRDMLAAGFSATLARELLEALPKATPKAQAGCATR